MGHCGHSCAVGFNGENTSMTPLAKPYLLHARYGTGTTKCGEEQETRYMDDDYMRTLPFCAVCFPKGSTHSEKPAPSIDIKPILTLRSYLA